MNPQFLHQQQYFQYNPYFYPPPLPPLQPPSFQDDLFRYRFATNQLGLLVRGAELILSAIYPWVDPQLRLQIDDWFCRKEECLAGIAAADNQLAATTPLEQNGMQGEVGYRNVETQSTERVNVLQEDEESVEGEDCQASASGPSVSSSVDKDLSDEIDSDEDIDEESDGSNADIMIDDYQTKFREILDEKIAEIEAFFDHYQCVVGSLSAQNLADGEDLLDNSDMKKSGNLSELGQLQMDQSSVKLEENDDEEKQSVGSDDNSLYTKILHQFPTRWKSDGEIYYRSCPRRPKKSVSVWDTGYDMSPLQKIDKCLTELQEIMNNSTGKEPIGVENGVLVSEDVQKSVAQLILTARSALQGSPSPVPLEQEIVQVSTTKDAQVSTEDVQTDLRMSVSSGKHVESQTDGLTLVDDPRVSIQSAEEPEIARLEVNYLRDARMSLVVQRKDFSDKLKQAGADDVSKEEERRLYEFEEAIEAIDTAIEFKNEIILGHNKCVLSSQSAPGKSEADLITRLTNLSLLDLQRLLCKYFSKVVELRFSSTKLEKALEKLESDKEKLTRKLAMDSRYLKERDEEHEKRIKHLLKQCNKDPNAAFDSHLLALQNALSVARRKQYDLERSLTELLVKHGYLLNGTDYDVKQIMRILGIDNAEMGPSRRDGKTESRRTRDAKRQYTGLIPSKLASALETAPGQGLSRRMKEASSQRRNAQPSSSHHYNYNYPQPSVDLSRKGHSSRHPDLAFDLTQRKGHSSRHPEPPSEPHSGVEVRRNKNKIVIMPSQPSSSHHHHHH